MKAAQIIRAVAWAHLLTPEQVRSKTRTPRLVAARIEIARRLTEYGMTTGQIARRIGRSAWTVRYYLSPDLRSKRIARNQSRWHSLREAA